jgi:8-oxo-dGTP pyrophosphatase MutT (NUDIX family)
LKPKIVKYNYLTITTMNGIEIPQNMKSIAIKFIVNAVMATLVIWDGLCVCFKYVKCKLLKFYNTHLKKCEFGYRGIRITTDRSSVRPSFDTICMAPKFLNWIDTFPLDKFDLRSINITDVDFFGPSSNPDKLGFLKFKCNVYTKLGEPIDSIVFLRGDCGAVLIIARDENDAEHVLLTNQPRIPTCGYKEEIVAGMFDNRTGNMVVNQVLKSEIKEETGLELDEESEDFQKLGKFTLSGGGCDESVHLAVWKTNISLDVIEEMKQKQFGEVGSNEKIQLKFYPVETFEKELCRIADAKTSLAWLLYKNSRQDVGLPGAIA